MNQPVDPYSQLGPQAQPGQAGQAPQYTPGQAAQAVQDVQQAPAGDAGQSLGQMATDRAAPLPAEALMNALMDQQRAFAEQLAGMQVQLSRAQADAAAVRAITGPPPVTIAADGIAAKLAGHKDANPDVPAGHFDQVVAQGRELAGHAKALADGDTAHAGPLHELAFEVERFLTRTHPRKSGKALDFSAVIDELDVLLEEAAKLAGVAA